MALKSHIAKVNIVVGGSQKYFNFMLINSILFLTIIDMLYFYLFTGFQQEPTISSRPPQTYQTPEG